MSDDVGVADRTFLLDAESLCSKSGFGDGDALDDWWWDTYDEGPAIDTDDLLHALVVAHLVPAIREAGHTVELERIATIHNPVRARTLDGHEVDHYASSRDYFDPEILVEVTREQIEEMVRKTVLGSGSTGEVPCEECSGVLVHMIDCSRRVKHHPTGAKPFDTSLEPVKNGLDSSHVPTGEEQG